MTATIVHPVLGVGLVTGDIAPQCRFYGEILGLQAAGSVEIPHVGTITRFAVGQSTLRLLVPIKTPSARPAGAFTATSGIGYLAIRVANLADLVSRVAAAGFTIAVPMRELRPGVAVALVEDADGNTVELMQEAAR